MASSILTKRLHKEIWRIQNTYRLELGAALIATLLNVYKWITDYGDYCSVSALIAEKWPDTLKFIKKQPRGSLRKIIQNEEYQNEVLNYMKFFVKRQSEIISYLQILDTKGGIITLIYLIGLFTLTTFYTVSAIYSDIGPTIAGITTVCFFIISCTMLLEIQQFNDYNDELALAVYDAKWYLWTNQNMKFYRLIHKYTSIRLGKFPMPSFIESNLNTLKRVKLYENKRKTFQLPIIILVS
ncbi:hypothetical protein ABEB36_002430 [Hypothenemus hampei]|uniref:Uncharacterized protein n=1 Tax=Hypothenemus hampei TaxID=57062 RepID=A0ABD1F5R2_HYPHA